MDPELKRVLEPALSKMMEHFTSQIQLLEKRVELAEQNVATEAERVRAELGGEHEKAVAEMRREHTETVSSLARVQAELRAEHETAVAKQRAEHEKAVAEMRREHTAAVGSLGNGLNEVRMTLKAGLPGFEQKITAQMAASVEALNRGCAKAEAGFLARLELLEQQAAVTQVGQLSALRVEQEALKKRLAELLRHANMPEAQRRLVFLNQRRPHRTAQAEGYSCKEVKAVGYSCTEAREVGYSCREAREAGYSCKEAKEGGFSANEGRSVYPCVVSRCHSCPVRT